MSESTAVPTEELLALFDPYDGKNVKPYQGVFAVYVPYADMSRPIIIGNLDLAKEIAKAIEGGYEAGLHDGYYE